MRQFENKPVIFHHWSRVRTKAWTRPKLTAREFEKWVYQHKADRYELKIARVGNSERARKFICNWMQNRYCPTGIFTNRDHAIMYALEKLGFSYDTFEEDWALVGHRSRASFPKG